MSFQRVHQPSPQKTQTQQNTSGFAARPLTVQAQQDSDRPSAHLAHSEAQSLEQAARFGHHFANILVHPPGIQASVSVQRKHVTNDQPVPDAEQPPNHTGLPDHLKAGIEHLSGFSLDSVQVHYNSDKPAQLNALAYTQGMDIHVAPGQERHLAHEAWHVVQQAQGRVRPTMQLKEGVPVNDDQGLEREADLMGGRAAAGVSQALAQKARPDPVVAKPVQRRIVHENGALVQDRNVAVAWKGGGAYADTPAVINGKTIPPSANKKDMILEPVLKAVNDSWRVLAAEQHVGWRIEAPTPGPWQHPQQVSLAELDAFARAGGVKPPRRTEEEDATLFTLIVRGDPDNDQLLRAIIVHEQHHVEEQNEVINQVLRPWDEEVDNNTASAGDPLNAWQKYLALGIPKAQDVADKIVEQMRARGIAFHETEAGKEPDLVHVTVDRQTRNYTVTLRPHPV